MGRNRSKTRRWVAAGVAILLLGGLACWRLVPRSLEDILSLDERPVVSLSCHASQLGASDGQAWIKQYALPTAAAGAPAFDEVMALLESTAYRPDFRNLLPWPVTSAGSEGALADETAHVLFVWGDAPADSGYLAFLGAGTAALSLGGREGFLFYHPTDAGVLGALVSCIQSHSATQ